MSLLLDVLVHWGLENRVFSQRGFPSPSPSPLFTSLLSRSTRRSFCSLYYFFTYLPEIPEEKYSWFSLTFSSLANMVFEDCVERIFVGNKYCEKHLGSFIIRGENIVLIAEIVRSHNFVPSLFAS